MGYSRSRARCVALQYPSNATRGVKEALNYNKKSLKQNLTYLQEKETTSSKALNILNKEFPGQVSQSGSGMFYELSNRKGMECEKYQDCSWFQQSPVKPNCNTKLSLVESFDPFIDADEFGLPMQCADAQISPWGDEYLEVFSDNVLLEEHYRPKEKNKNWISNENFYPGKEFDDNTFDSCNINYSLKKTDSLDSMKNISSTNPAKVIPISYKEKLNNANYGQTMLDEIKKEVKLYSPGSSIDLIESDDSELNIGREEVVEEMNFNEDVQDICGRESLNSDEVKLEVLSDCAINNDLNRFEKTNETNNKNNHETVSLPVKIEPSIVNKQTKDGKFDLNLDIAKLNFDQTINVNTPDLDFMDLVDFINEEMRQENDNPVTLGSMENTNTSRSEVKEEIISPGKQTDMKNVPSNSVLIPQSSKFPQNQPIEKNLWRTDSENKSTVDINEIFNPGVSIAERIKTSCKRRTTKNLKDFIDTEDESCESSDDNDDGDDDDDYDYDYKEDLARRKCVPIRKRMKSSLSESSGEGKKSKGEDVSYREKRDKNNEASRRSRQNRKARERHMYETLEEEEKRNVKLKAEADVLEKQVTSLRQLLLQVVLQKGGAT